MKKIILSLLTVAGLGFAASAQNSTPVKFGIKAGVAFPNMTISAMGVSASFDPKTSYYVGGTADFQISDMFSIQPGLTFTNKGTKISGDNFEFNQEDVAIESASSATLNFMYIEVPVNAVARFNVGNAGKVFIGAGPYFAYAVSANAKAGGVKEDIKFGASESGFKRTDLGLNFMAGYELNNGFNIHAGYGLGLSSILDQEVSEDVAFKNKVFSVGLGYSF
ncbi:porin family protein [Pedobacter punctiformis]|uniref:Porin family protein n=1 Tax=Pedobacter punctiformis TaxID=3004097 RepID=A0ABT4L994_9SPHI|nr:porin family protein [Pedobacter sp. HCMS5-2]MCZ4244494.1 porin family protein [Pedobacter sp. HCMS5-2]